MLKKMKEKMKKLEDKYVKDLKKMEEKMNSQTEAMKKFEEKNKEKEKQEGKFKKLEIQNDSSIFIGKKGNEEKDMQKNEKID